MNKEKLSKALGDISTEFIEEAEDYRRAKPRRTWAKVLLPLAACLAIAAVVVMPELMGLDKSSPMGSSTEVEAGANDTASPPQDTPSMSDAAAPEDASPEESYGNGETKGEDSMETESGDLPEAQEPSDEDLVLVKDYIPTIYIELRYAAENNFTGQVIYDFEEPQLRYGTVKKLVKVQEELLEKGFSLKIWDGYRPVEAQFKLWEVCPDGNFVADPTKGFSSHSRGNTLDVTLVLADGTEIQMPTDFDDFSAKADRDYSDVEGEALENVELLEDAMERHGFKGYKKEWWHFSDEVSYPVVE